MNNDSLYEGLIISQSPWITIDHLERWAVANGKFIAKENPNKTITLKFIHDLTDVELDNLLQLVNNLGWYVSSYVINKIPYKRIKFDKEEFRNDGKKYQLLAFFLEAKFDRELDINEISKMFHITRAVLKDKILINGLVPRSNKKQSYHPERIYLAKSIEDAYQIGQYMYKTEKTILSEVDITMLRRYNNNIRFFVDPQFKHGAYTLENIPPKFLKIL